METATIIAVIIGVIAVFVILREVFCWYFKINERIDLLKKINQKLGPDIEPEQKKEKT